MKLIYISDLRFPSEKIHSYFAMKTCESYASEGVDVELWIPNRSNKGFAQSDPFLYYKIKKNFSIRHLPVIDIVPYVRGRLGFFLLLATFNISVVCRALMQRMRGKAIFYLHNPFDAIALSLLRPRMFIEVHELHESMKNMWWAIRKIFSRMQGFITTNRFKANFLQKNFGIPEDKIICQQNVADVEQFKIDISRGDARKKLGLSESQTILLYTGHLYDWKGLETLFGVHEFLKGNEVLYIVGGMETDVELFRSRCRENNIRNIILTGQRPHEEMPLWTSAADALLVPHSGKFDIARYEASPVKLFEYMASGRPIVVADLPSLKEIADSSVVWYFEPDNPESLVNTVRYIVNSPAEAADKAVRAQTLVFERYTWQKRARAILSFVRVRKNMV